MPPWITSTTVEDKRVATERFKIDCIILMDDGAAAIGLPRYATEGHDTRALLGAETVREGLVGGIARARSTRLHALAIAVDRFISNETPFESVSVSTPEASV
jgi:hypothetical protein